MASLADQLRQIVEQARSSASPLAFQPSGPQLSVPASFLKQSAPAPTLTPAPAMPPKAELHPASTVSSPQAPWAPGSLERAIASNLGEVNGGVWNDRGAQWVVEDMANTLRSRGVTSYDQLVNEFKADPIKARMKYMDQTDSVMSPIRLIDAAGRGTFGRSFAGDGATRYGMNVDPKTGKLVFSTDGYTTNEKQKIINGIAAAAFPFAVAAGVAAFGGEAAAAGGAVGGTGAGAASGTSATGAGGSSLFGGFGTAGPVTGGFSSGITAGSGLGAFGGFGAGATFGGTLAGSMAGLEAAGAGASAMGAGAMSNPVGMTPFEGPPNPFFSNNPIRNFLGQFGVSQAGIDSGIQLARIGSAASSFLGGGGLGGGGGSGGGSGVATDPNAQAQSAKAFLEAVMPFIRFNSSNPGGSANWTRNPDGTFSLSTQLTGAGQTGFNDATNKLSSFTSSLNPNQSASPLKTSFGGQAGFTGFGSAAPMQRSSGAPILNSSFGGTPSFKTAGSGVPLFQQSIGSPTQNGGQGLTSAHFMDKVAAPNSLSQVGAAPNLQTDVQGAGPLGQVGTNANLLDGTAGKYQQDLAKLIFDRTMSTQSTAIEEERRRLQARMVEQGFAPQNEGYGREMKRFEENLGEMRNRASMDAQIQSFGQALQEGEFTNRARQQTFDNNVTGTGFNNKTILDAFNARLAEAGFENSAKTQGMENQLKTTGFNNSALQADFDNKLKSTGFNNTAKQTDFDNQMKGIDFQNDAAKEQFLMALQAAQFGNQGRQQQFDAFTKGVSMDNESAQQDFQNRQTSTQFSNDTLLKQFAAEMQRRQFDNTATQSDFDNATKTTGLNNTLAQQGFDNRQAEADFFNKSTTQQQKNDMDLKTQIAGLLAGARTSFLDPLKMLQSSGSAPTGSPTDMAMAAAQQGQLDLTAQANKNASRNDLLEALLKWGLN
jgi:hypothetical protein